MVLTLKHIEYPFPQIRCSINLGIATRKKKIVREKGWQINLKHQLLVPCILGYHRTGCTSATALVIYQKPYLVNTGGSNILHLASFSHNAQTIPVFASTVGASD